MTKPQPRDDGSTSHELVAVTEPATTTAMGTARLPYLLLTRKNYEAWAIRMRYLLQANGAWGVVVPETSSKVVDEAKDHLALSIISQSIDDEMLVRVAEKDSTLDVWTMLRSMHVEAEHVREARIQSLRLDFDKLKMSDADYVDEFAAKFTGLVGRIHELGETLEEKYTMKKLLCVVSNKFISVVSSMALFSDVNKMVVEEVIGSLKAHEELLKGQDTTKTEE